jgi:hypothetical protein
MKLLEHPGVLARRRELEDLLDRSLIKSYSNLRWSVAAGVSYSYVPRYPLRVINLTIHIG